MAKKFKTIVYIFLTQNNAPFSGQKVDMQLVCKNTELWDLISSKLPDNYLSKTEFFSIDEENTISGKHLYGSKKIVPLGDFTTALSGKDFNAMSFRLTNQEFCVNFVDYFAKQNITEVLPETVTLVLQRTAA